jgi:hypothetical protein
LSGATLNGRNINADHDLISTIIEDAVVWGNDLGRIQVAEAYMLHP